VCGAAIGCTASGSDVQPVRDQLAFPTGMKVSPDGKILFVANANSELRYDSGSLNVFDLGRVNKVICQWLDQLGERQPDTDCMPVQPAPDCKTFVDGLPAMAGAPPDGVAKLSCTCDSSNTDTLQCDEAYFINPTAGVRIGNFATDLSLQDFSGGGTTTALRVFAPTRGDPSISWADFDGTQLHCTEGSEPFALCDDAHRLTSLYSDPNLQALPNEPFAVFADAFPSVDPAGNPVMRGFAMVTHLASGAVTLIDAPGPPSPSTTVQITDILIGVFGDPTTATRGATSIAALRRAPSLPPSPAPGDGFPEVVPESLYVSSNTTNRVQLFDIGMRNGAAGYLLPSTFFSLDAVGVMVGSSTDSRAIRFSADGKRLYLVSRTPPSLQVYDTTPGLDGTPRNALLGSSDLCREASAATVAGSGTDERVYVTCFQDGQVYVVDPFGQSQVEDIITVGRGPYAVDVMPPQTSPMSPPPRYLFVSNFLEDTIAVIDIAPNSPTRHRVVLRMGAPRAP
jgi:DNA-binding beta-propeller fold protein YncE